MHDGDKNFESFGGRFLTVEKGLHSMKLPKAAGKTATIK
jgi:hypothetical protein